MQISLGIEEAIAFLLFLGLTILYIRGWRSLRRAMPLLATRMRLVAFFIAIIALTLALVWPLPSLSNYLLAMRSMQKVSICFIAAPLLWLSVPVQTILWGVHGWPRHAYFDLYRQPLPRKLMETISHPLVTWFAYVAAFLFWHDSVVASYLIGPIPAHTIAPWVLVTASLLFWWPVVDTGPRFNRTIPTWLLIIYLFGVEVANMVAGITIAFSVEAIYPYYPALRAKLPVDTLPWGQMVDQIAGGAIIWVLGSVVYFSAIVFVLLRLFRKDGSSRAQPLPNWDDNARFIAPGLEHRVSQNKLRNVDLSHH